MDYKNGKIYKLQCDDGHFYIGSTATELHKRFSTHKSSRATSRVYTHINNIGWHRVRMVLIENFPCKSKLELNRREDEYIGTHLKNEFCLNTNYAYAMCSEESRMLTIYSHEYNNTTMTPFMQSVKAALMDPHSAKPYKESSVKPVMIYLKKLAGGDFDSLDFLKDRKSVDQVLSTYAESTQRTIVFVIDNVARAMKRTDIQDLYKAKKSDAVKHRAPVDEETGLPVKTATQEANWMTWEEIIAKRDALLTKNTEAAERQYVALSLYTMAPPRRNRDYLEMDIVPRMNKKKTDRNQLVVNKSSMKFVFNQYKTDKTYGQQVIKVPKMLEAVLRRYIGMLENKTGPLFGEDLDSNHMTKLLNAALGKHTSSSILRHVYLEKFKDPEVQKVIKEMMSDASAMAHAVGTQQGTYVVQ